MFLDQSKIQTLWVAQLIFNTYADRPYVSIYTTNNPYPLYPSQFHTIFLWLFCILLSFLNLDLMPGSSWLMFFWKIWIYPNQLFVASFFQEYNSDRLQFALGLVLLGVLPLLILCQIEPLVFIVCLGLDKFDNLISHRTNIQVSWIILFICSKFAFRFVICFSAFHICLILMSICSRQTISISLLLFSLFLFDLSNPIKPTFFLFFSYTHLLLWENILAGLNLECKIILYLIFLWILTLMNLKINQKFHIFLGFQLCDFDQIYNSYFHKYQWEVCVTKI